MRHIKTLVPAAIAITVMGLVGASSATAGATQLCLADPVNLACPAGETTTSVHYEAFDALLVTPNVEVECDALFSGTAGALGQPQHVTGNFAYNNCTVGCSLQQQSASGVLKFLKTASELAVVTQLGEVLANCIGVVHCIWDGDQLEGYGLGGLATGTGKGYITYNEDNLSRSAGGLLLMLCPGETELTALFVSLENLYIAS